MGDSPKNLEIRLKWPVIARSRFRGRLLERPVPKLSAEKLAEIAIAAELVRRIRTGDRQAESELVNRYSRGLLRWLKGNSGNEDLAWDLHQETFATVITKIRNGDVNEPEKLAGYIFGIAKNLHRAHKRKNARQKTYLDCEAIDRSPDDSLSAFAKIAGEQLKSAVLHLLSQLTQPRDKEVLLRYYVYDEDKQAICNDLGLDSLHFNRVLHRARERFKKIIEDTGL